MWRTCLHMIKLPVPKVSYKWGNMWLRWHIMTPDTMWQRGWQGTEITLNRQHMTEEERNKRNVTCQWYDIWLRQRCDLAGDMWQKWQETEAVHDYQATHDWVGDSVTEVIHDWVVDIWHCDRGDSRLQWHVTEMIWLMGNVTYDYEYVWAHDTLLIYWVRLETLSNSPLHTGYESHESLQTDTFSNSFGFVEFCKFSCWIHVCPYSTFYDSPESLWIDTF